ncbi:MAG: HNH endonuclease [Solibacillus sp.]
MKPSHYDRKKYCSRDCKTQYQKKNPPQFWSDMKKQVEIKCSNCNKVILRKPSCISKNNFCDMECKRIYQLDNGHIMNQHLRKDVEVYCKRCNNKFVVPLNRANTAKYCSRSCLGKANGERAKRLLTKKITINCSYCHQRFEKKISVIKNLNFCNADCMGEYYSANKMFSGSNSPTWNGGKLNYYGPNWRSQRRKVRLRDNYTCQDCGIKEEEYGQELSVHHIIPFKDFHGDWKKANELSNLVSLCEYPCHRKRHSKMVDDIV